MVVGDEQVGQHEEDRDGQPFRGQEGVDQHDVDDDGRDQHRRQRDETARQERYAADQFDHLHGGHEVPRGREPVVEGLHGPRQLRRRDELEQEADGGEEEEQPHQTAHEDRRDFHEVASLRGCLGVRNPL